MQTVTEGTAIEELPARDVCAILQPIFPGRKVYFPVLTHYKTLNIVQPSGVTFERYPHRCYTYLDAVAVAAAMEMYGSGVDLDLIRDIVSAIQRGALSGFLAQGTGNLWISYDPEEIAGKVRERWDAFIEKQGGS